MYIVRDCLCKFVLYSSIGKKTDRFHALIMIPKSDRILFRLTELVATATLWFLLFLPGLSGAQTCQAEFLFAFTDNSHQRVVVFNTSEYYAEHSWNAGAAPLLYHNGSVASFEMSADTIWICLDIWDNAGCADQLCQAVYAGSPDEMCEITDCIWPGDANGDGKANQYDVLNIGKAYGATGLPRAMFPVPANPIAWAPNFTGNWPGSSGNINHKHADTNGDGLVDASDVNAIALNYSPDWFFTNTPVTGNPPVFLELETPLITITDHSPNTFVISAKLMLGEAAFPLDNAYGIALDVVYPFDLVMPGGASIQYDGSLLGAQQQTLVFMQDLASSNLGRQDWAATRTGGLGVDGHGPVATLNYVVSSDIIGGRTEPEVAFNIIVERVRLVNANGDEVVINLPNGGVATAIIINDTVARGKGAQKPAVKVFPNPAGSWLYVEWQRMQARRIELLNALGQPVLSQSVDGAQAQLSVSGLQAGMYVVLVHADEGTSVQHVQIR